MLLRNNNEILLLSTTIKEEAETLMANGKLEINVLLERRARSKETQLEKCDNS